MAHVGSFKAKTASGEVVTIQIHQVMIDTSTRAGQSSIGGLKTLMLNGESVRRIGKGEYETLYGEKLTSDDPSAP